MRRRIVRPLTMASLLLCVGSGGLWARAQFYGDQLQRTRIDVTRESDWVVRMGRGGVAVNHIHATVTPSVGGPLTPVVIAGDSGWSYQPGEAIDLNAGVWPSVSRSRDLPPSTDGQTAVFAPFWFLVAGFGVLPAIGVMRRRPAKRGCCARCGYDLRASPGRCPECGATV